MVKKMTVFDGLAKNSLKQTLVITLVAVSTVSV